MIDIIIPAYNAHHTIGNTLGSIAKQINRDSLKVYIINDGSKKDYRDIISNYKELLDIQEIDIENSSPGAARQVGINSSNSEYIVFIDADDTFYNEYSLLNLINIIPESDIAEGHFIEHHEEDSKILEPQYCYLHGKMFRRSIIEKYNLHFENYKGKHGDLYEDDSFNQLYLLCCETRASTQEIIYNYEYNPKSLTKSKQDISQNLKNYVKAMTWLVDEIEKRNLQNNHGIAWHMCIISFHCYFQYLLAEEKNKFIFKSMSKIKKMYDKYIDFLTFEERLDIYRFFNDYPVIPAISFYDFMSKC